MRRKLIIFFSSLYVGFMAVVAVYYYLLGSSFYGSVGLAGVLCGAVPLVTAGFTRLPFNLPIVVSYLIFLFGAQYLGSILNWYGLGWWDTFVHGISGAILAFCAIASCERLVHPGAGSRMSPLFVFLFTVSITALGGVLWEIYEFSSDYLFGTTMQGPGGGNNEDTMTDLIADVIGGLVIALWNVLQTKRINDKKRNDR
ncbi:hypothetical protein EWI07_08305 [Sporolactobacillus sp. THM7-4]|nr:hypothetical protein EWI07_08305 [Sporolactobacillus sp. THM7-4]